MKIAETKLWMVTPDGKKKRLTIVLGKPYRKKGHGACPIAIRGLYPKIADICGEDTWQALILAIKFVRLSLIAWTKKGCEFTFPDGSRLDPEVIWFKNHSTAKLAKLRKNAKRQRVRADKRRATS